MGSAPWVGWHVYRGGIDVSGRGLSDLEALYEFCRTVDRVCAGGPSSRQLSRVPGLGWLAQYLRVNPSSYNDSREFARIQERLRGYGAAPSMAEIARSGQRYPTGEQTGNYPANNNPPSGRVSYPSSRYQSYNIFNGGVQVNVPSNWRQVNDGSSVWFVPEGAYGSVNGQAVYTHGASFGVAQTNNRNLQSATEEFINSLAQGNNSLRMNGGYQRTTLSGRNALFTTLSNVNESTGRPESVRVITTQLRNGQLFYMIAVAPQNERGYENAFQTIMQSVRIND